mgnify:CR=1 FL=1
MADKVVHLEQGGTKPHQSEGDVNGDEEGEEADGKNGFWDDEVAVEHP